MSGDLDVKGRKEQLESIIAEAQLELIKLTAEGAEHGHPILGR